MKRQRPLIEPARCTDALPEEYEEWHVAEPKMDGARYVLYLGKDVDPYNRQSGNTLLSRRESTIDNKYVDRTKNIPHITGKSYPTLQGTILDCEAFHTNFETTSSVMGSGPEVAVSLQKEIGNLTIYVFDILYYKGKSVRGLDLSERRKYLERAVKEMKNRWVQVIEQRPHTEIDSWFDEIVKAGGEGLIIKDLRCSYGSGWAKKKKSYDVSCIVTGFKPGKGKYVNHVGSLQLSVYDGRKLVEIGFCSGFDDKLRMQISKDPESYLGRVVDVFAQEWTGERLRHCTFHRFRDDVKKMTVTLDKVIEDLQKNAKSRRRKQLMNF